MEKSKELVKYHNDLNKLNMSSLKEKELELFYAICVELKQQGNSEIKLNINEFKKDFNISNKIDKKRFADYIEAVHNKFLEIKTTKRTSRVIESMNFFKKFRTDLDTGIMEIQVNEEFSYFLNNLVQMYTRFSFLEFQNLNGKYSKLLMPHLMQWNSVKEIFFTKEELFDIFGVNDNYKKDLSNFNRKILNPTIKELTDIFYQLECKKIKKGREITGYSFQWEKETPSEETEMISPGSSSISADKSAAIPEYWKNHFSGVNYTSKHKTVIDKLLKTMNESQVINYLQEQWEFVKNNPAIENGPAYFSSLILEEKAVLKDYVSQNKQKELSPEEDRKQAKDFMKKFPQFRQTDINEVIRNMEEIKSEEKEKIIEITEEEYEEKFNLYMKKNNLHDVELQRKIFNLMNKNKYKIKQKKKYTIDDIPEEKLLSKSGKKLVGAALQMKINKILEEMNK